MLGPTLSALKLPQTVLSALKCRIRLSVAPVFILVILGTPLESLFRRVPIRTSVRGATLHLVVTVVLLHILAIVRFTPACVSSIPILLRVSRKVL